MLPVGGLPLARSRFGIHADCHRLALLSGRCAINSASYRKLYRYFNDI